MLSDWVEDIEVCEVCEGSLGEGVWVGGGCWEGVWEGVLGLGVEGEWVAFALFLSMPRKVVITLARVGF